MIRFLSIGRKSLVVALLCASGGAASSALVSAEVTDVGVPLDKGHLDGAEWTATVEASKAPMSRRPCITALLRPAKGGRGSNPLGIAVQDTVCRRVETKPITFSLVNEVIKPMASVLVLAFERRADRVRLVLRDRPDRVVRLSVLSADKSWRANVRPFTYAVIGFSGIFCLKSFTVFSRRGETLFESGDMRCSRPRS